MRIIFKFKRFAAPGKIVEIAFILGIANMAFCPLVKQPHHQLQGMNKIDTGIVEKWG